MSYCEVIPSAKVPRRTTLLPSAPPSCARSEPPRPSLPHPLHFSTLILLKPRHPHHSHTPRCRQVPIVKFDHKSGPASISVDICLNNDSGVHTGAFLKHMVENYPPLRPLTMLLKVREEGAEGEGGGGVGGEGASLPSTF